MVVGDMVGSIVSIGLLAWLAFALTLREQY
jgi:hypothetical protein